METLAVAVFRMHLFKQRLDVEKDQRAGHQSVNIAISIGEGNENWQSYHVGADSIFH